MKFAKSVAYAIVPITLIASTLVVSGCATQGQNRYDHTEVGHTSAVEFGTIVAVRQVDITGQNTGVGAVVGGTVGGGILGGARGGPVSVVGGILVGAVAGAIAEQAIANRLGLEYVILLRNGKPITIVQNQEPNDRVFQPGERVMVQASRSYQRVLPADNIPAQMDRPVGITVKN